MSCTATFVLRDSLRHEVVCSAIASHDFTDADVNHGFVCNKRLCGVLEDKACKECLQHVHKLQKSHVVLISPSAMQLCGIVIGSHVEVETFESKSSTFVAWPCCHIPPSSVFIDPEILRLLSMDQQKNLYIFSPGEEKYIAARVHLKIALRDSPPFETSLLENVFLHQFDNHLVRKGNRLVLKHMGKKWLITVIRLDSAKSDDDLSAGMSSLSMDTVHSRVYSLILSNTQICFDAPNEVSSEPSYVELTDFGGGHEVVEELKKLCTSVFQATTTSKSIGPRGVLLYGPPGTGKSLLVRAVAGHFKVPMVTIQGPELFSKYYGETEARLREKFEDAIKKDCCIIYLDEIDSLCPKRDSSSSSHSDQERRVVATLLSMIDSIPPQARVAIIGVSSRPDVLDSAVRRPGRLDRELEIRAPTVAERKDILNVLLRKIPHRLNAKEIDHLASITHGFVGADLSLLCAEASLAAAKRIISSTSPDSTIDVFLLAEDTEQALHLVKPSAMREVLVEVPNVRWTDIGGQADLKLKLKQAVEWPLRYPEAFQRLGVEPPRGLLMFGPPGCSKTMIAKALATESGLNFIAVKGPELFSKWVGESERAVREVFRRARQVAPAIVFLDELDALGSARGSGSTSAGVGDRVLAQLLTEMDGIEALKDVTVVAATNRPDMIDKALLRPGRLDRIVYVPLPDDATRKEIIQLKFNSMPIHPEVSVDWLVSNTCGYSGAEVAAVCNEAALRALEQDIKATQICRGHFEFSLSVVTPRITSETVNFYENYVKESGLHAI